MPVHSHQTSSQLCQECYPQINKGQPVLGSILESKHSSVNKSTFRTSGNKIDG